MALKGLHRGRDVARGHSAIARGPVNRGLPWLACHGFAGMLVCFVLAWSWFRLCPLWCGPRLVLVLVSVSSLSFLVWSWVWPCVGLGLVFRLVWCWSWSWSLVSSLSSLVLAWSGLGFGFGFGLGLVSVLSGLCLGLVLFFSDSI